LSVVADFALSLHESGHASNDRALVPVEVASRSRKLTDIRAVIFDVYGTLINYWRPEFAHEESRRLILAKAFRSTADRFGFTDILGKMNGHDAPETTLQDLYHGLIALSHEKSRDKGLSFPEVKIEEVWRIILMMLQRHGFDAGSLNLGDERDVAGCMAYCYNFHALGRGLYPGVVDALAELKRNNILLGIVSNAQFYTPMDLTLFVRDQSQDAYDDYADLFDTDLVVYSYEEGSAKPGGRLFRRLYDSLYEYQVLPSQTVFVGNDLQADVKPAQEAGMKTALFAGDRESTFLRGLEGSVVPDVAFDSWEQLPRCVSFFGGGESPCA
jgi:putative hydrolase of the HAD superfamily